MIYVVLSIFSGLCSWGIPFLRTGEKNKHYKTILSFGFCILSIYLQIVLMKSYGDEWTLIVDALGALTTAVPVLAVGTIVSNVLSYKKG